jgi:hypothetical protein
MSKEQTAVEQFAIALYEGGYLQGNGDEIQELLEQHLKIEKEQMIEMVYQIKHYTYFPEYTNHTQDQLVDKYYNETYGGN